MSRKPEIVRFLRDNREHLRSIGVKSIGLFGSVARGEDTEESDIDFLVEFDRGRSRSKAFQSLCDVIEKRFGENFDLVSRDGLSPYIGPEILKEAEYVEIAD